MLTNPTPQPNPFLPQSQQQQKQPPPEPERKLPPENNKGRGFRRAGNACELIAGTSLNSAIVFTFHLLQIHPAGMILAVGAAHLYFTATATGEGVNKAATNAMTGASMSLAILCSLSEPIGEWWEASQSKSSAKYEIQELYSPQTQMDYSPYWKGAGVIAAIAILLFALKKM